MRPGARLSRMAKVMAMSAGPRVQLLTMQLPSRTRSVVAAMAPSTETASRASLVSVTQSES